MINLLRKLYNAIRRRFAPAMPVDGYAFDAWREEQGPHTLPSRTPGVYDKRTIEADQRAGTGR